MQSKIKIYRLVARTRRKGKISRSADNEGERREVFHYLCNYDLYGLCVMFLMRSDTLRGEMESFLGCCWIRDPADDNDGERGEVLNLKIVAWPKCNSCLSSQFLLILILRQNKIFKMLSKFVA
jgi:hypothetical protein